MDETIDTFHVPPFASAECNDEFVEVKFNDGKGGKFPFLWLRDNCRCCDCYDCMSLSRIIELSDLSNNLKVIKVCIDDDGETLHLEWDDNHRSIYDNKWLYCRGFTASGRKIYNDLIALEKEPWGNEHQLELDFIEYNTLLTDEKTQLNWLRILERKGVAVIKNAPTTEGVGGDLVNSLAFLRRTQFGLSCTVKSEKHHSYRAFTTNRLGLHTDCCYYADAPGVIFIHTLKQSEGLGGESLLADGIFCAELMRRHHNEAFNILTSTNVYFWDKSNSKYYPEGNKYYKINKTEIISLNLEGKVEKVTFNNNKRDSFIDRPMHETNIFYEAFKKFLNILYDNTVTYKMQAGDILTMDNTRCLHGREGFDGKRERLLEVTYLDWDEAKALRRCLEEKMQQSFSVFH